MYFAMDEIGIQNMARIHYYFNDFQLTFHFGGDYLASEKDYEIFNDRLNDSFQIAKKHGMHDISIHPPYAQKLSKYVALLGANGECFLIPRVYIQT